MSFKIQCSLPAPATLADAGGFLFLFPCVCHWFFLSVQKVCLGMACISEVKQASLVQPSTIHGSLSLLRLRNLMKRWACLAGHRISDAVLLCLSQSCAALCGGLEHMFARHRGRSLSLLCRSICCGLCLFCVDGENGQICQWEHRRKNHDLCTCFRLEGSTQRELFFEWAHV